MAMGAFLPIIAEIYLIDENKNRLLRFRIGNYLFEMFDVSANRMTNVRFLGEMRPIGCPTAKSKCAAQRLSTNGHPDA